MIDLTPLDVRKKRGDFAKALRGYDVPEVDNFLELVAERMEVLVKENLRLQERSDRLGEQVEAQEGRENAVQEALVTAQQLREDVKSQAEREAEFLMREARGRIDEMVTAAGNTLIERRALLEDLERQRERFLKAFRTLLDREMDAVEVESNRAPIQHITLDFDVGLRGPAPAPAPIPNDSVGSAPVADVAEVGSGEGGQPGPGAPGQEEAPTAAPEVSQGEGGAADSTVVGPDPGRDEASEVVAETDSVADNDDDSLWLSSILTEPKAKEAE